MRYLLWHRAGLVSVAVALTACATQDPSRVTAAAIAPLNDFNLVQAEIPPVLAEAQAGPYAVPPAPSCAALDAEIGALDAVLGADLDAPPSDTRPSLIERGAERVKDEAVGALRRTTEGVVPFRGWVRKLSGAERYSKKVAAAIAAGSVRRAFIKGLRVSLCTPGVLLAAGNASGAADAGAAGERPRP